VLLNWGNGPCHFFPDGDEKFIDELESLLEAEVTKCPTTRPVLSSFTELPSNPLLRSVNLPRLRQLADKYDFVIAIDETVGNFVNVDVLPYADILTTSLSKLFSGAANVTGGRSVPPAR
jgi:cystathionine gamma-synthase